MASVISKRYAQSLFELAEDEEIGDQILLELSLLRESFLDNPDFLKLLSSLTIPKFERIEIVDEVFSQNVGRITLNFLKVLIEAGRISAFSDICDEYRQFLYYSKNIQEVIITTALELSDSKIEQLKSKLSKVLQKTVVLEAVVDPTVLGGMLIETMGRQLDGTVKARLKAIKKELL